MQRSFIKYQFDIQDVKRIKEKVLQFVANSDTFSYFDNNQYQIAPNRYELLVGKGIFKSLQKSEDGKGDWVMGHLNFERDIREEHSISGFTVQQYFIPYTVILIPYSADYLEIHTYNTSATSILEEILSQADIPAFQPDVEASFVSPIDKEQYLRNISQIKSDIYYGKYYEINYCIPYKTKVSDINPVSLFHFQNQLNPAPMAAFYRQQGHYLICTSPERFLFKQENQIICQPIKGTAPKSADVLAEDAKSALYHSEKDRAENVMIVDLTRSDLAKICEVNTVKVSELFGIYTFPYLYQMISTIRGSLKEDENFESIMDATFPMGSMTGAPKPTVITHIQKYETTFRGIYSGSLFYINPEGDFDSNVIIRSIQYDAINATLEFHVGGAITYDSIPDQEWEELEWKAYSMKKAIAVQTLETE